MSLNAKYFQVIFILILIPVMAFPRIRRVPETYSTIQAGINAADAGDTVLVAAGTYRENITFDGNSIHLLSEDGPEVTIIHGRNSDCCVLFESGEDRDAILEGFTLTNGSRSYGAGIYIDYDASPTIRNNIITGNVAETNGGGIFVRGPGNESPRIENNVFSENTNGAIYVSGGGSVEIVGNEIESDTDGLSVRSTSSVHIEGNTVNGSPGAGLYIVSNDSVRVLGNTVNSSTEEGIYIAGPAAYADISRNEANNNGGFGIVLRSLASAVTDSNVTEGNGSDGQFYWFVDDITSTRNQSVNNAENGAQYWECDNVTIDANHFTGNTVNGLYLRTCEDVILRNNRYESNEAEGLDAFDIGLLTTLNELSAFNQGTGYALWVVDYSSIVNSVIYDNPGGGLLLRDVETGQCVNILSALNGSRGVYCYGSVSITITNSIVWGNLTAQISTFVGNNPVVTYCDVGPGAYPGTGNISLDPQFEDPEINDYTLSAGSPCIDAGNNTAVPNGIYTDLNGHSRFVDDPDTPDSGVGDPPFVDMGAYEFQPETQPRIELSTAEMLFEETYIGETDSLEFTISNTGDANLRLYSISNSLPDIFQVSWDPEDTLVAPGELLEIEVLFTPATASTYQDTITVINNDSTVYLSLAGEGLEVSVHEETFTLPEEMTLLPAYPNPFNSQTVLRFTLPDPSEVELALYDLQGRFIEKLLQGERERGIHELTIDGAGLTSGGYFVRMLAGDQLRIIKIVLVK